MRSSWPPVPIGSRGRTATQPEPATIPDEPEHGPLRRCLVTRAQGRREEMLRFVAAPDGTLVFDPGATLPGRGMWLSATADVIELAVRRGVFARAARAPLKLPESLHAQVEAALARRLADLLGLARRSGAAISGFEKAREWLQAGRGGLIVQAADGSIEERARFAGGRALPCVAVLSAAALGKIFGREHTVHVVISPGRLAQMIELEARRLLGVAKESVSGQ
ncbi:MAG: RNA-binding protein [Rhodospirillales bacterium]|nr:RNA-binding protein [Rhodospirillales bacterium]